MKLSCQKNALLEGLQILSPLTSGATTKPILQAVKIEALENKAVVEATDLEVGVRFVVEPVDVQKKGVVVLQEGRLVELLREWTEERVDMELQGSMCLLSGKGMSFKLATYPAEEFPVIPQYSDEGSVELEAGKLAGMIRKVAFACASERVRHTMTGVLFQVEGGMLKLAATDGRRLAHVKEKGVSGEKISIEGIVPKKGVEQLARVAGHQLGSVDVRIGETHLLAKTASATLCAQLIEGQFPNYKEAIPTNNDKKIEIDAELLASALRRASILTTDERHVVKIGLQRGRMIVEADTPEVGEARVELEVDYAGEALETGFNPDFLLDALKAIGKGPVQLEFKEPTTAAIMKSGQNFVYVVMPIRLAEVV